MATVTLTTGQNQDKLPGGLGAQYCRPKITVDMSTNNLAAGALLKVLLIPKGTIFLGAHAQVRTIDSVSAGTVDVGLYAISNDGAIDADGLINELALGTATDTHAVPASTAQIVTVDAFVGLVQGAGAGGTYNDAVVDLFFDCIQPPILRDTYND